MEPFGSTDSLLHRQVRKNRGEGVRPLVERKVPLHHIRKEIRNSDDRSVPLSFTREKISNQGGLRCRYLTRGRFLVAYEGRG